MSKRAVALGALCALSLAGAAHAEENQSAFSIYAGKATVTKGYSDRDYIGAFLDAYEGRLGVHADFAAVNREQNGVYGAVGLSWQVSDTLRPKLMVGTSSNNFNILPKTYVSGSLQIKPTSMKGWIFTPSLTYRDYRSGGHETRPALDVVLYLPPKDASGYWVAQANAAVSVNNSSDTGYSLGGGIQMVRASGLTAGISAEGGKMTYDSLLGIGVQSKYWAIRPAVGYRSKDGYEIYLRGEYADTDFYDVTGLLVGLKHGL